MSYDHYKVIPYEACTMSMDCPCCIAFAGKPHGPRRSLDGTQMIIPSNDENDLTYPQALALMQAPEWYDTRQDLF